MAKTMGAEQIGEDIPIHFDPNSVPEGWICDESPMYGQWFFRKDGLKAHASLRREADGKRWLHVSLSYSDKMPTYEDMKEVKTLFIGPKQVAYQLFVDDDKHVSWHDYCLHLWHCVDGPVTPDFSRGLGMV